MGIGFSLFLFVVGAILTFAMDATASVVAFRGPEPYTQDRGRRGPGGRRASDRARVLANPYAAGSRPIRPPEPREADAPSLCPVKRRIRDADAQW